MALKGFGGRLLFVNLDDGSSRKVQLDEGLVRRFLGGLGFASYFLLKEVPPGTDPLSPGNALIIAPGSLVGTGIPTASKTTLVFRSPLTGAFGRSVAGASLGPELKKAGYDMLLIKGRAPEPSILVVDDDQVYLEDAKGIWGEKDALEAQEAVKERLGRDFKTGAIGPAGEKLSLIAGVDFEERQAARAGPGAVMGSKNLKAVAVRGTGEIPLDSEAVREQIAKWTKIIKEHPATKDDMNYGTGEFLRWMNLSRGTFPSRNFQWGYFQSFYDRVKDPERELLPLDPYHWAPKYTVKLHPCPNCTKPCGRYVEVKEGPYAGAKVEGVEYELLYALGGMLEIGDIEAVIYLNEIVDRLGLDGISAGVTVAWAMEAFERGLLTAEDLDGIEARFGDPKAAAELLWRMGTRQGKVGQLLGDGVARAVQRLGKGAEFAMHIKGLELPAYDIRGIKGMALAEAVSYRGACHLTAVVYGTELVGKWWKFENVDRLSAENKGWEVKTHEDLMQLYDATGICKFSRHMFFLEGLQEVVNAVHGLSFSRAELMAVGERIYNMARIFNVANGFSRKDDTLPPRVMRDPIPKGPSAGARVTEEELQHMLDEYYEARGWDRNGVPTKPLLSKLELEEFSNLIS
ncbi:MAG: aldehyde:ferredoxin oxidoreductase [Thermoplasmata archaeon]|nr:MAG: aldehyde:ferredoxin oxidoreductase [Thermoplasmata archaeon]HDJ27100.1 aldehyde:ferredoxin oxidoreductase [Aciduliprofundum sp.]